MGTYFNLSFKWNLNTATGLDMKKKIIFLLLSLLVSISLIAIIRSKISRKEGQSSNQSNKTMPLSDKESEDSIFDVIWSADFQNQQPGIFDYNDIEKEFGTNGYYQGRSLGGVGYMLKKHPEMKNDQNITIEEEEGNLFTRNWFEGGHYGGVDPNRPEGSGHMFHPKIPGNHEELWISHNIRWPNDRDWGLSGKLGVTVSGGTCPGACSPFQEKKHNGFRINLMWSKDKEMKFYLYWPGKNDSLYPCGLSGPFKWDDPYKPGKKLYLPDYPDEWHNITLRIVLNDIYTPGKANGRIEAFWDGMLAFSLDTLRLRTEPGVYIDHARSRFNHGGGDNRFAPNRDTYYDCDDVWTWTWEKDSGLPTGTMPWNKENKVPLPNYPKEKLNSGL